MISAYGLDMLITGRSDRKMYVKCKVAREVWSSAWNNQSCQPSKKTSRSSKSPQQATSQTQDTRGTLKAIPNFQEPGTTL